MNLRSLTGAKLEVAKEPLPEDLEQAKAWKITTEKLARQLEKKKLKLVEDGTWPKVVDA
jgi:hypothetical protein